MAESRDLSIDDSSLTLQINRASDPLLTQLFDPCHHTGEGISCCAKNKELTTHKLCCLAAFSENFAVQQSEFFKM
jgi:hypothetical protein